MVAIETIYAHPCPQVNAVTVDLCCQAIVFNLEPDGSLWLLGVMQRPSLRSAFRRETAVRSGALAGICLLGGLAIAGPSGLFAWSENLRLRDQRSAQLATLIKERDALDHRVRLLDANGADPDLVSELIRKNLDVVHPDEVVVVLKPE